MPRTFLYVVVAVLAGVGAAFGYRLYQDQHGPEGVEISFDGRSISLEKR